MGITDIFKKKEQKSMPDLPPVDAPPLPQDDEMATDVPPAPDPAEMEEEAQPESLPPELPPMEASIELPKLDPLGPATGDDIREEDLEAIGAPEEEVEMPEEMPVRKQKAKGAAAQDDEFSKRLGKVKAKLHAKEKSTAVESDVNALKTENEYLRGRVEKLSALLEGLPITEMESRIEEVKKAHRDHKARISDAHDKLTLHTNLINEIISVRDEFHALRETNADQQKQVSLLADSLDSYKNTLYMLNKKVEISDNTQRIDHIEVKIKEIIVYLNKITRIITKD